jgi:hypothetical protein
MNVDLTDDYFAYGADLDLARLRARAGDTQVVSPARLAGYRVAFFGHDPVWDSGMETLVADDQAETWGVLYRLRPLEWERLDLCMGANLDGAGAYFHYPVEVTTPSGETRLVRTYRKSARGEPCPPSREFLAHLLASARARGLPESYLATLSALPSTPARYPVPKQDPAQRRHLHVL